MCVSRSILLKCVFWYHVNVYWIRIHWKYFTLLIWPIKLPTSYPSFFSFHVGDCLFIIHEIRIRLNIFCLLDSWAFNWNEFFDYKVFDMLYLESIYVWCFIISIKNVLNYKIYIYPVLHIEWTTLTVQSDKLFMLAIDYKHTI